MLVRGIIIYVVLITIEERLSETDSGLLDCKSNMNDRWQTWCQ